MGLVETNPAIAQYRGGTSPDFYQNDPVEKGASQKGSLHLRWYPMGLINTSDINFTLGADYGYGTNKSLALDLGYIFASIYGNAANELKPASGLVARVTHRWYIPGSRNGFFWEAEAAAKLATYQAEDQWVGRGVVNGVPAYEQLMPISSKKNVFLLNGKFGQHVSFAPGGRLGFEWCAGLGIRYRDYYADLPDDAMIQEFDTWGYDPWDYGSVWLPDMQVNLRLTWKLK